MNISDSRSSTSTRKVVTLNFKIITLAMLAVLTLNVLTGLIYTSPAYANPNVGGRNKSNSLEPQIISHNTQLFAAGRISSALNVITQPGSEAIRLGTENFKPPTWSGNWAAFGMFSSEVMRLDEPFSQLRAEWQANMPEGTRLELDLRASPDGENWTLWEVLERNSETAFFSTGRAYLYAQYRVRLFTSEAGVSPAFKGLKLEANRRNLDNLVRPNALNIMANADNPPPTYKVYGTREGLVGWRTANGHTIQPRDRFVSLPSWTALNDKGKTDYQVRITAPNGRSAIAPVWDTGPWNFKDNYWHNPRFEFKDLPVGVPQAEKAFYEKHNGGKNESGVPIDNPSGIDIGDGTYWDDLGLAGASGGKLDVTFIWEGSVPSAAVISGTTASNVGSGTAIINWNTNIQTNGWVEYGFDTRYGLSTSVDNRMLNDHSIFIGDLVPNKTYHFRVHSKDIYGTEAISQDATFTTTAATNTKLWPWQNDKGIGVTVSPKFDSVTVAGGRVNNSYWNDNPKQDINAGASTVAGNVGGSGALDVDIAPMCDAQGQNCAFGFGTGYKGYVQFTNKAGDVLQIGLIHDQTLSPNGVTLMVEGKIGENGVWKYGAPDSLDLHSGHHIHVVWMGGQIYLTFDFTTKVQYAFNAEELAISFVGAGRAKDDVVAFSFQNIGFSWGSVVAS